MKNLAAILFIACTLTDCKKKSAIQEDLVILAMTTGQWKVTSFVDGGVDRTTEFASYRFKYYSNNTVDAVSNGTVQKTGTWNGSASTMSISADFPNAVQPLVLINGNWNITRNSWTYVEAGQSQNGQQKTLRLDNE